MKIQTLQTRKFKIGLIGSICFFIPTFGFSDTEIDEFTQFKNQQNLVVNNLKNEFELYKMNLEAGFTAYKRAYQEAFKAQKKEINKLWGDFRPGNNKQWVEYEKGGVRKSVDFETGEIELEMVVEKKEPQSKIEAALKKRILALLLMSKREAFKNDPVAQAVEKEMTNQAATVVETAIVPDTPMLSSLVPEVKTGNTKKITQLSKSYEKQAAVDVRPAKKAEKKIVRIKFKVPTNAPKKSQAFLTKAQGVAEKEKIPLTLVMAVMEAESAFNPMAKSHIPAYGLMQIVPKSAGQDATAYLFGKAKILSPSYLYNPDKNIEIGGAYLHILYFRYLKKINNPVSRLYCAIAAYNTGAGNVARAFIGNTNINKASVKINQLTPQEVYQKLRKDLPHRETQNYIKKVSLNMQKYQQ